MTNNHGSTMNKKRFYLHMLVILTLIPCLSVAKSNIDLVRNIKKNYWFEQGNPNAVHQIYVIAEPNCSACHYLYSSITPYIGSGTLKVRWILVAFLKPSSLAKAAVIISSNNPALALENNEVRFNSYNESGGITLPSSINIKYKQLILSNNAFFKEHNLTQTPIIIFRSHSGQTEVLRGAPDKSKWPMLLDYIGKSN